jgi:hypothetical protein
VPKGKKDKKINNYPLKIKKVGQSFAYVEKK